MAEDATLFYGGGVGQPSAATMGGFAMKGWGGGDMGGTPATAGSSVASPADKWGTLLWVAVFFAAGMIFLHLG